MVVDHVDDHLALLAQEVLADVAVGAAPGSGPRPTGRSAQLAEEADERREQLVVRSQVALPPAWAASASPWGSVNIQNPRKMTRTHRITFLVLIAATSFRPLPDQERVDPRV